MQTEAQAFYNAALGFARRGMPVFPCQPRGKAPATSRGLKQATVDLVIIENWWGQAPDCNIGLLTGDAAGFFVLDIDGDRGETTLHELEKTKGALPPTIEAITGNGRHCYFRLSEHGPVRNSAGKLGPGLDIRGDGGYVLAPPSLHPTGRRYEWSVDSAAEFADAPDWLHDMLADTTETQGKPLEHWHAVLTRTISNGTRNATLASIAGKLLFHDVNLVLVRDLLLSVNTAQCEPPLSIPEVETIVASVAKTNARQYR